MYTHDKPLPLYSRDSRGKIREWRIEIGTDSEQWGYRTISGLQDGEKVTSQWKIVVPKNVGKANETSAKDQAYSEVKSQYTKKRDKGYFDLLSDIDSFAKFKPMLATDIAKVKIDYENEVIFSQPKLDGIRCIVREDGMWTRSGKEITSCPHIYNEIKEAGIFARCPGIVIDGELYNHDMKDDFNRIVSLVRKAKVNEATFEQTKELVEYHVYDVLVKDRPHMRFGDRLDVIKSIAKSFIGGVRLVVTDRVDTQCNVDNLYGDYLTDGYEGQILRKNTQYENKRTKSLIKRKEFITDEFPVVAVEEGLGNWSGHVKRFVLRLPTGREFGAGVRGSQETLKALHEAVESPSWATVRYFTPTPDGIPRFPVVIDYGYGDGRED